MVNKSDIKQTPYEILNITPDATRDEIKVAYRKLALKYHPDKCKDDDAEQKFKRIHAAYEILSDPDKRKKYDSLNNEQKLQYYDELMEYINISYPNLTSYITNVVKLFYDNEDELRTDINTFDFNSIYNKIMNKIPDLIDQPLTNPIIKKHMDLDIIGTINIPLIDRYMNRYKKLKINRTSRDAIYINVPLRELRYICYQEGELNSLNEIGNIVINIEIIPDINFFEYEHDIHYIYTISLYEYLYGGTMSFTYIDNTIINKTFDSMINNIPIITIDNLGNPYENNNEMKRGKLTVFFKIKNIDNDEMKKSILAVG
jgi:DnaJ-class molecular chaperone